jgi:hypothetical protein
MMHTITCAQCQVPFGLDDQTYTVLKQSSTNFHCPWGHSNYFPKGPTEAETLRTELNHAKQREARLRDEREAARSEAEHQRRRALGFQGQAAKVKKRVAAGTCPCCKRTFKQLAAHMASQHPEFSKEKVDEPADA